MTTEKSYPQGKSEGRRKVSAVIAEKEQAIAAKLTVERTRWPEKGGKLNGVGPGAWRSDGARDDTGFLPEECPVTPLGREGENYYFVDTFGEIFCTGTQAMGVERTRKLFAGEHDFLYWAWPSWTKTKPPFVNGFKNDEVHEDLYAACRAKGAFSTTQMVRGRGAWRDDTGRLILHCGEALWIDGEIKPTGEHGEHFYVRRPKTFLPWPEPVEDPNDNPAVEIFKGLRSWNMVRGDVDALLLLGWAGVALMGAALDWRPSVFLVGDAGTGKSSLIGKTGLIRLIFGRAMIATTNATEAGLYQLVGHDSLPIAVDELEGADGQAQAQRIIKMARDAASGSIRIRGGADHKGVEFEAMSTFLFSAINPPPLPPASLTRLAMIQLRQIEHKQLAPKLIDADKVGPKLLRRVADHFRDFDKLLTAYKQVLMEAGHDSRGQDTFGTLLAAGHLLLDDRGMDVLGLPFENLSHWGSMLKARMLHELTGKQSNWGQCIENLLTATIEGFQRGERMTVGKVLADLEGKRDLMDFNRARDLLGAAGLGLVPPPLSGGAGYALAVPHTGRDVSRLLVNTDFATTGEYGAWSTALSQAPEHIVLKQVTSKKGVPTNRLSIGGVQRRCQFVDLMALKAWQDAQEGEEG